MSGTYHADAREYSPTLGRWVTTDPLLYQAGDNNFYRFVGNNPGNRTDPSGLEEDKNGHLHFDVKNESGDASVYYVSKWGNRQPVGEYVARTNKVWTLAENANGIYHVYEIDPQLLVTKASAWVTLDNWRSFIRERGQRVDDGAVGLAVREGPTGQAMAGAHSQVLGLGAHVMDSALEAGQDWLVGQATVGAGVVVVKGVTKIRQISKARAALAAARAAIPATPPRMAGYGTLTKELEGTGQQAHHLTGRLENGLPVHRGRA